ncbi:uncharacterized protein LOC106458265 [Limulus polyphemus]|uniref:Uncharacterized protein LOC106458265 n=1 Tax=Limulus polyphemus TaxID=6850 RepID=A0ABM1B222_LIMPO|nr:uncharacterized protein LOC106458265 [Limulus polyphemus]
MMISVTGYATIFCLLLSFLAVAGIQNAQNGGFTRVMFFNPTKSFNIIDREQPNKRSEHVSNSGFGKRDTYQFESTDPDETLLQEDLKMYPKRFNAGFNKKPRGRYVGLNERPKGHYVFGLDKRDAINKCDRTSLLDKLTKRIRQFNFGLGKRLDCRFAFGLGKRDPPKHPENDDHDFLVDASGRIYHEFVPGLDKRSDNRFGFGWDKKFLLNNFSIDDFALNQNKEHSREFGFDLDKLSDNRFKFGLDRKSLSYDPIVDDTSSKLVKPHFRLFNFGLGKRAENRFSFPMAPERVKRQSHKLSFDLEKQPNNQVVFDVGKRNSLNQFSNAFGLEKRRSAILSSGLSFGLNDFTKSRYYFALRKRGVQSRTQQKENGNVSSDDSFAFGVGRMDSSKEIPKN